VLLSIHVAAGGLAIVFGAAALLATKGRTIHRRSGRLFAYAMLGLGFIASLPGFAGVTDPNVLAGFTVAYFVGTALTTVRPASPWTRRFSVAAPAVAIVLRLAAAGDVRVMGFGAPRGRRRLARHRWRMCFALFIAAGAFFSIRERAATILPGPFTTAPRRALPILLPFTATFY
jgi:hypothetical protein